MIEADKYNLKVLIPSYVPIQHQIRISKFEDFIKKYKDDNRIYGYTLWDEPNAYDMIDINNYKIIRDLIYKYSPQKPVSTIFTAQAWEKVETTYSGLTNVEGVDVYPFIDDPSIKDIQFNVLKDRYGKLLKMKGKPNSYLIVFQAFDKEPGKSTTKAPTYDELKSFLSLHTNITSNYSQHYYFAWNWTGDNQTQPTERGLRLLPDLQINIKKFIIENKYKYSAYPVRY